MSSFGIVIATCKTDSHYAQASFWSIRHFLGPDMPVCFIVDGDATLLGSVRNDPQVSVLDRNSVANTWLREHCFGWGTTKMIAFYEAPFERFLYLDADALVIGNVPAFDDPTADMVTDCGQSYSDQDINFWFFNTESVERLYPDFDWRRFRHSYFCTGTFFSRKGVFSLEDLQEKMRLAASHPELFHFGGEMGFLNLMIFRLPKEALWPSTAWTIRRFLWIQMIFCCATAILRRLSHNTGKRMLSCTSAEKRRMFSRVLPKWRS